MGKLSEFSITFTSLQVVYYPGQQVAGYVTVDLKEPMKMRGIEIHLMGEGYCHWTEEHTSGSGEDETTETEYFTGSETLVAAKQVLVGDMSTKFKLPAGKTLYQFNFALPSPLPSSFESSTGHIRYYVKAKIDKPWKFDHKVKRPFTVNDIIDTNNPIYAQPVGGNDHADVGCCCWKAGPVDMTASIDRRCYCPGEAILVTTNVQNQTSRDMQNMHAKLTQTISYHASSKTRTVEAQVARLVGPPIPRGEEAQWLNQPFGVPALPPTIGNSTVISIHYKIKIVVAIPCAFDADVKLPVVLGTVPFQPSYGQQVQYDTPYDAASAPPQGNFVCDPTTPPPQMSMFGYPDMAPPSYSAVVGQHGVNIGGDDDKHTYGDLSYNPVYTFAQPYQGNYQPPPQQELPYPPQPMPYPPQYPPQNNEQPPEYQQQVLVQQPEQTEDFKSSEGESAPPQQQQYPPPSTNA